MIYDKGLSFSHYCFIFSQMGLVSCCCNSVLVEALTFELFRNIFRIKDKRKKEIVFIYLQTPIECIRKCYYWFSEKNLIVYEIFFVVASLMQNEAILMTVNDEAIKVCLAIGPPPNLNHQHL